MTKFSRLMKLRETVQATASLVQAAALLNNSAASRTFLCSGCCCYHWTVNTEPSIKQYKPSTEQNRCCFSHYMKQSNSALDWNKISLTVKFISARFHQNASGEKCILFVGRLLLTSLSNNISKWLRCRVDVWQNMLFPTAFSTVLCPSNLRMPINYSLLEYSQTFPSCPLL